MSETTVMQAKRFGVLTCSPDTTLIDTARRMTGEDVSALVVVDLGGYLAGIITRTDLLRACARNEDLSKATVASYMNRQVVTVGLHASLNEVRSLLLDRQIHRVVVVRPEGDRQRPVAVVSAADLVYHIVKELEIQGSHH
jgi:CBS domain-containing protein